MNSRELRELMSGARQRPVEELAPWVHLPADEPTEDTVQRLQAQIAILERALADGMK